MVLIRILEGYNLLFFVVDEWDFYDLYIRLMWVVGLNIVKSYME